MRDGRSRRLMEREVIRRLVEKALRELSPSQEGKPGRGELPGVSAEPLVPVGISARHVHLSPAHVEELFGPGYQLNPIRELLPGQFAAQETVLLVGPKGVFQSVRVLGPARWATQVEVSRTDAFHLGVDPPVRDSGQLEGTPGLTLVGPRGAIHLERGVICAKRHIHLPPFEAPTWGLEDGALVRARVRGERGLVFGEVLVRVHPSYRLELHLDTDEANAAGVKNGDLFEVL